MAIALPSKSTQEKLFQAFSSKWIEQNVFQGDYSITVAADQMIKVIEELRSNPDFQFDHFVDLCGVDYAEKNPRFEVAIQLLSMKYKHRIRLRVQVPNNSLKVPSLTSIWKGADWQEREAYDMYGILFEGHPELKRILSPPGTQVHPQRKEYPLIGERALEAKK